MRLILADEMWNRILWENEPRLLHQEGAASGFSPLLAGVLETNLGRRMDAAPLKN
jgi:hypothetical protein